jgi:hypothetical protein
MPPPDERDRTLEPDIEFSPDQAPVPLQKLFSSSKPQVKAVDPIFFISDIIRSKGDVPVLAG